MKSSDIRNKFLEYFRGKGHKVLPGSSLVPKDPSVLLTLAGMLQFKPVFLGMEKPVHPRAATVQKCIRMIDVERVGRTPRHHTFFEMLGNFSFGDYFKKEAIEWAWELLTKEFKLPAEKLQIAVFEKDDEAFGIWEKDLGLPANMIHRLGEDNNFWAVGPTGPCGPCSEIYYDHGQGSGCGKPDCKPGCDCDRFLEIWNLVFIQYNRNDKGELIPLHRTGIDTGMGLERITAVLQGVSDNFETDIFQPLISDIRKLAGGKEENQVSLKIIADHIRAVTHLIADGVFPENVGRGYVLRRLIRRAIRHGKILGINRPFLSGLSRSVVAMMGDAYPVLKDKEKLIEKVINEEEEHFLSTLEHGIKLFEEMSAALKSGQRLSGGDAFKLHDTYGFPVELTVELAAEKGLQVDVAGFEKEMEGQRERARQSGSAAERRKELAGLDLGSLEATVFSGYQRSSEDTEVTAVFPEKKLVVLVKTPFYGESGGQVGDTGIITWDGNESKVVNTFLSPRGTILHELENVKGLQTKTKIKASIDISKRKETEAHHTATHLLHKALRQVLGDHVKQSGSYVGPDKLRFDFSHFQSMTAEEIERVEHEVNRRIKDKIKVDVLQKRYDEALKMGAMALFGEKYGEEVRVLKVGDYSLELCGGTHVSNTGDIGFFKVVSEGAVGSGMRRIEALAGQAAKVNIIYQAKNLNDQVKDLLRNYQVLQVEKERCGGQKDMDAAGVFEIETGEIEKLAEAIDSCDSDAVNKILAHLEGRMQWLKDRIVKLEKEIEGLKARKAKSEVENYLSEVKEIAGKKILLKEFKDYKPELLRSVADALQSALKSCILVLASSETGKVGFLVAVTPDLVKEGISAKALASKLAEAVQGRSGGKEAKAEGGGKDPTRVKEGFEAIIRLLGG